MIGPQCADAHDGRKHRTLHHRPDIRLHPNSVTATIVFFLTDIREESIYPDLLTAPSRREHVASPQARPMNRRPLVDGTAVG